MSACVRSGSVRDLCIATLVAVTVGSAATAGAALPGETGQIAFSRGGDIWVANPDGTEEAQLTSGPENDRSPRWSPEGNRMALVRDGELVLLDATGALLRVLTTHGDVAGAPSWSPDGRSLAYVRGSGGIAVVEATLAGSNGAHLDLGPVKSVAWNPSPGERIAYTHGGAVFTVRPDGSEAGTEIVPPDLENRTRDELAWSPQTGQVVFTSTAGDGTSRIEGPGFAIDGESGDDRSPAWSPDGQRLLFTRAGTLHAFSPLAEASRVVSLGLGGATPDAQPSLISTAAAYETETGTQLFFRVRPVGGTATLVGYQTASGAGTATADIDYSTAAGEVVTPDPSFGNDAAISISIGGDAESEQDETFFVDFTFPSDPAAPLRVRGTILNDDGGRNGAITYTGTQGVRALDLVRGVSQLLVPAAGSAVFSPRGDRLAYVVGADASPLQLVVADASGVAQVAFPVPGGIDHEITWSPDGAHLAWTAGATLWVADPSSPSSAIAIATDAVTPSWSSDPGPGPRRLAFARPSTGRICTVHEDGSSESCPTVGYQPRWSPDNTTIAFLRGTVAVFLMSPDGTNERLVASATGSLGAPLLRWSPRGGYFAFMTGDALFIRQEGGPQTMPAGLPPSLWDFDWSPDGNRLVVQGISPAVSDPRLWVVGPDEAGTAFAYARLVGDGGLDTSQVEPRWSSAPFRPTASLVSRGGIEVFQQARADVRLSAPSPDTITLTWETVDTGTATPGIDYVPVSGGTVVLQPGEMNTAILVTLLDDALQEGPEFFEVRLADASGAQLGPDRQVPVFITDDEVSNVPPTAADDGPFAVIEGIALTVPAPGVIANDADADGDPMTARLVTAPAHGTVTLLETGSFEFTASSTYSGPDSFTYVAHDGQEDSGVATVSLVVHPLIVAIDVSESIHVTDDLTVQPAVMIDVAETITVTDTITLASPLVTVSPASGVLGGTTTLTATLTSLGAPVPGQPIDFSLFGNPVLGGATTGPDGVATVSGVSLAGIAPGVYPGAVQASFAGDATLGAASGSGDLTVSGHPTNVTLASSVNPSIGGQDVTFTVTVHSAAGVPQGSVELTYRLPGVPLPSVLGTVSLEAGTASLTTSDLKVGDLVVTARYLGNETFEPSSGFLLQTVTPAPTTTTLAASSANAFTTRPPVFTATVDTAAPWPATGSVEFFAGGVSIGRAPVFERGGVHIAVMGGAALGVGTHTITARYGGDAFHLESETGPFAQTVIQGDYVAFDLTPTSTDPSEATAINASDRIVGYSFSSFASSGPRSAGFLYSSGLAPLPGLGGPRTIPVAINDAGQVVGWSATAANVDHAFLYQGGLTTDLGTLGGATSQALAINNAGQIVGTSETSSGTHAFLYEAGTLADLGTLGGSESTASAINASGFAAGSAELADGTRHASFYTRPWLDLGTLGGTASRAIAINDAGQVAGTSDLVGDLETHAFLWHAGQLTDIAGPAGPSSTAFAVNDAGQVVGWTVDPLAVGSEDVPPAPRNAFLYSGGFTVLGTLSGGTSQAFDISNSGLLVGVSDGRAFVSSGALLRDLGTLGGSGSAARAINDRGVIIGAADTAAGVRHAVAWLPVPVPTLSVPSATGELGATTTLSATLTLFGAPLANQTIAFTLNGAAVGSATTNATGTATLGAVSLGGLGEGTYAGAVQASYDGFGLVVGATRAAGDLTVTPAPIVIYPELGGVVPATRVTIGGGPGDRTEPHVSGDLLSYTVIDNSIANVHFYRFSSGADTVIPGGPPGTNDTLSEVTDNRIGFSRTFPDGSTGVMLFDADTSRLMEIDPRTGRTQFGATVGGDTIAFAEFDAGSSDVVAWNVGLAIRETVGSSPAHDGNPRLSPDGSVLVWERCVGASCDIDKARRVGGAWVAAPVTTTLAAEGSPDTDGTWIVYDAYGRPENPGGWGIYLRPVAGGAETRLAIPGAREPSISRGVISFEGPSGPGGLVHDVFVYVIATNTLYQVTDTPTVNEFLSDVSVLPNGDIRVVWAAADDVTVTHNIYAVTFTSSTGPAPPTAVASGGAAICEGASSPLAGSGGVSCSWAPAAGLDDASSCTPSASPLVTTTYTLTVTSAGDLPSTNAPTVTVTVNPRPTAVASGTATITAGQSTPLSGSGGDSCLWSPAAGLDDPASCAPNAAPALTTTYALTVSSAAGCVSASATVTVTVVPPRRTLSLTKVGLGSGTVTSAPAAIDCGPTCAGSFEGGSVVTLSATPDTNFAFGGWTGDPDCADGIVIMDADKACTAAFNRRPNLKVSALSAPRVALAGATIAVTDTTRNSSPNGGPAFPGGTTRLYLSADDVLDPADTVLGERSLPPLPPGAVDSSTTDVTIPVRAVGTYWIIAKADADNSIPETAEDDNTRVSKVKVGADLRVAALSGLPAKAGPGETITATDTTVNAAGASGAGASATGFYLSADAILDGSDASLGHRPVSPLAPGGSEAGTTFLQLPAGLTPGTWYVIAKADFDERFAELDEADNTRARPLLIGPPDLRETALQAPGGASAGASIDVRDVVKNDGAGTAGPTTTGFYLPADATLGPGDTPLGSRRVAGLAPGEASDRTTSVVIPAGTTPRSYFLIAVADADGDVAELDEGNNQRARAFTVR